MVSVELYALVIDNISVGGIAMVDVLVVTNNITFLISALGYFKESLIKSRLSAWHAFGLHIFRHITQKFLDIRQYTTEISDFVVQDEWKGLL